MGDQLTTQDIKKGFQQHRCNEDLGSSDSVEESPSPKNAYAE